MKNKVIRDWFSVLLFPLMLFGISYFLSGIKYDYSSRVLFYFSLMPDLFLVIASIIMARMVNLSIEVYQNHWIIPVLLVQLILPLFIIFLPLFRLVFLKLFLGRTMKITVLLFGTYIFNIIKAFNIQWKNRNQTQISSL